MFSLKHIIMLLISISLIVALFFVTKKWSLRNKYKGFLIVAVISEVVKIFFYIIKNEPTYGGLLPKSDLPFQLCSIQIIFALIVFFSKNEKVKRAIMSFMFPSGLIGGLAAILIPTYSALNFTVITCQYFIYHAVLMVLALQLLFDKELKFTIKDYFTSLIFVFCLMFFAIYINSMFADSINEVNFMYVVEPPAENLPFLNKENGWFIYICHYAMLIFASITICYIRPIIQGIKSKIHNSKNKDTK